MARLFEKDPSAVALFLLKNLKFRKWALGMRQRLPPVCPALQLEPPASAFTDENMYKIGLLLWLLWEAGSPCPPQANSRLPLIFGSRPNGSVFFFSEVPFLWLEIETQKHAFFEDPLNNDTAIYLCRSHRRTC